MRYILIVSLFLLGCASVQPLSGGSKDEIPPKVLSTSIDSAGTYITSNIFEFTFDEYIQQKQALDKLLISPNQSKPPTITVKKKKLIIELNDPLIDSTTYTFQFNGAVTDINESNSLNNYNFIFSTGSYIDSGRYSGTIIDYLTKKPCDECNVYLYNSYSDTSLLKVKPAYLARTDEQGKFQFNNLPNTVFYTIALQDKNSNIFYDKDEQVSLPKTIHIDSSDNDTLYTFTNENTDRYKIEKVKTKIPGTYQFTSNRPLLNDSLAIYFNDTIVNYTLSFNKDTLTTYFAQSTDTLSIRVIYGTDTFLFNNTINLSDLKYTVSPKLTGTINSLYITSKTPINYIDTSKILLMLDSVPATYQAKQINTFTFKLKLHKSYKKAHTIIQENAFNDIYQKTNILDTLSVTFLQTDPTTLSLIINGDSSTAYIITVNQPKSIVYRSYQLGSTTLRLNNLDPGNYFVSIYTDSNKNGIWDTGNLFKLQEPEPVVVSKQFELRENWDKELIINVSQ